MSHTDIREDLDVNIYDPYLKVVLKEIFLCWQNFLHSALFYS